MKKIVTPFLLLILLMSCKKDNTDKPAVADIPYTLYDLRSASDIAGITINYPSTLVLKGDFTWTLEIDGAISGGTYTWSSTHLQQAQINFTILQWTPISSDPLLSTKIRSVLEAIDNCGYTTPPVATLNFLDPSYTVYLRTNKK